MMNNALFQNVFDILQKGLPDEWDKVILYAMYDDNSYSIKYYVSSGKGKYTDCFNLGIMTKAQLIKQFMEIDKVISSERKTLSEKEKWTSLTMTIESNGKFLTKFDYSFIEDPIEYEQKWKKLMLR